MGKIKLEHYNLMTKKLRETVDFYSAVLGLYEGFYPVELGPGAWLYDSTDTPVVHMQEIDETSYDARIAMTSGRIKDGKDGAPKDYGAVYGSSTIDHIAFNCLGFDEFKAKLDGLDVPYGETALASANVRQIFLRDPNGIVLELNFRG
jgi:catechol 2,3-dioxygenase-like lactoylglutathione lyase family enzyme